MTTSEQSRAARLDTIARLELARHAASLLHSKEEALQRERSRLAGHENRTRERWLSSCRTASERLLDARALGAGVELDELVRRGPHLATVTADWQDSMGIVYPGNVTCDARPPTDLTGTAALVPTTAAYRDALDAATEHAATTTALERLDAELAVTRRRRRAIADHLVPRIEADLHGLELMLEEQDREEAVRLRLAVDRRHVGAR